MLFPTLALASCSVDASLGSDLGAYQIVVDAPAQRRDKLDLLFVIDTSAGMAEGQKALVDSVRTLRARLDFGQGLPDTHIGVVSSDMGTGSETHPGCSSQGHKGRLAPVACGLPDDFLSLRSDVDGEVQTNYSGELEDVFSCMAELGEAGCEYEQPLKAMRTALDGTHPSSSEFLRPDAALGVFVLASKDDCSAFDPSVFDPNNPDLEDVASGFRCFQSGVECDGDDVFAPGSRFGCKPRKNSPYLERVDEYTHFIETIKPEERDRIFAGVIGDPKAVEVQATNDGAKLLAPACQTPTLSAQPGVRIGAFLDSFSLGHHDSVCDVEPESEVDVMLDNLRQAMGTTCLRGKIHDIDPLTAGRQPSCFVYREPNDDRGDRTYLPACDYPPNWLKSSELPCYTIQTGGEACGDFPTQLVLQVRGDNEQHPDKRLVASCLVD